MEKAYLGFEPETAGLQAQTSPLSHGPMVRNLSNKKFGQSRNVLARLKQFLRFLTISRGRGGYVVM